MSHWLKEGASQYTRLFKMSVKKLWRNRLLKRLRKSSITSSGLKPSLKPGQSRGAADPNYVDPVLVLLFNAIKLSLFAS